MFDAGEIGMIRLPYGKKNYDNMLTSCFQPIPERHGRMDGIAIASAITCRN